jgi:hypothetical protein
MRPVRAATGLRAVRRRCGPSNGTGCGHEPDAGAPTGKLTPMMSARSADHRVSALPDQSPPRPTGITSPVVTFDGLFRDDVTEMRHAAEEIGECYRVLRKARLNIVGEVLRGHGTFYEDDHYPPGDVFDAESGSQYYYHAHRGIEQEHGHFHTFLRGRALRGASRSLESAGDRQPLVHVVGISMDPWGYPSALFAVNRWVTGESWLPAAEIEVLLARFRIDHAWPSWPVNRWISAMLTLFRPQVVALLRQRDAVIEEHGRRHAGPDPRDDTALELTGWLPISVERQIAALEAQYSAW